MLWKKAFHRAVSWFSPDLKILLKDPFSESLCIVCSTNSANVLSWIDMRCSGSFWIPVYYFSSASLQRRGIVVNRCQSCSLRPFGNDWRDMWGVVTHPGPVRLYAPSRRCCCCRRWTAAEMDAGPADVWLKSSFAWIIVHKMLDALEIYSGGVGSAEGQRSAQEIVRRRGQYCERREELFRYFGEEQN